MKILGIIPARGGSKGIPQKNIRKIGEKPLIQHSIEAAKKSKINKIIVSTDDQKIAKIAKKLELKKFSYSLRPCDLINFNFS